jgi:DNA-binding response OmpR family regulator
MATRVLLIEDEPLLVSLYALVLARAGFDVKTAMTLREAEEHVIQGHPHVVLLDLLIPTGGTTEPALDLHEPTGLRLLRFVKDSPALSMTRVIVLSNLDSDEHVKSAMKLGADGYVVKSNMDPHLLAGRVHDALHAHPSSPQF